MQRIQVGQYFVEGTPERAVVVERRMGKDYVINTFSNSNLEVYSAFEQAVSWLESLDPTPKNLKAEPIPVVWFDLNPVGRPNQWKSECPVCHEGTLVCERTTDGVLKAEDRCLLCGQRVIYQDIQNMRTRDR